MAWTRVSHNHPVLPDLVVQYNHPGLLDLWLYYNNQGLTDLMLYYNHKALPDILLYYNQVLPDIVLYYNHQVLPDILLYYNHQVLPDILLLQPPSPSWPRIVPQPPSPSWHHVASQPPIPCRCFVSQQLNPSWPGNTKANQCFSCSPNGSLLDATRDRAVRVGLTNPKSASCGNTQDNQESRILIHEDSRKGTGPVTVWHGGDWFLYKVNFSRDELRSHMCKFLTDYEFSVLTISFTVTKRAFRFTPLPIWMQIHYDDDSDAASGPSQCKLRPFSIHPPALMAFWSPPVRRLRRSGFLRQSLWNERAGRQCPESWN